MSVFAINLITGLGLGLSIDYSLFMVSRFREEMEKRPRDRGEALRATMRTAGRTVLFSAVTVAAALAALIVFPLRFLYSMGVGGVLVSLGAALVSLTRAAGAARALGPRVNALSPRRWRVAMHRDAAAVQQGGWYRLSQAVMRRPGPIAVATAVLLIVLGLPFTRIEFTGVDASVLPHRALGPRGRRRAADRVPARARPRRSSWPCGRRGGDARGGAGVRARRSAGSPAPPSRVAARSPADGLWRIDVSRAGASCRSRAKRAGARRARRRTRRSPCDVGGATAGFLDQQESLADSLPLALAILATTTLVILFLMTGSVVLPIKALVMNLLTLSAAFGLLVLIFQDGRLEGLLAYDEPGRPGGDAADPAVRRRLRALHRLRGVPAHAHQGGPRRRPSATARRSPSGWSAPGGSSRTPRCCSTIAIGAFATSEVIFIKEVGVGTALAVLIDAFLVRALLVPSLMALLGRWNWWAPRPLARLHARFGLQEASA